MPRFTPQSREQILTAMIAKMVSRTRLNDVGDISAVKHLLSAAAHQDAQLNYQATLLLQLASIDSAAGDDLDAKAQDIQPGTIRRILSAKAVDTVVFTRRGTTGNLTIPAGTKVKTSGGILFSTTAAGTITATSPEQVSGNGVGRDSNQVPVIADVAGAAGNVVAGTITGFAAKPAGIDSVVNLTDATQGRDKETDPAFRARIKAYVASLARCNRSALENQLINVQDPDSGATILFAKVVEDLLLRGNVTVYIDDGTGTAESVERTAEALPGTWTWNGTTTVAADDTTTVVSGDFIRLDSSPTTWFQINTIVPNTSVTLLNPGAAAIPTGATGSSLAPENMTDGLSGPPVGSAVGGETVLRLAHYPVKDSDPLSLASSTRGNLVQNTDWIINPASGQINFLTPLTTGEKVVADYTYYVGLIAYAQKIIDGDPNDRENFPGYRAAGVFVLVITPQVLLQTVIASLVFKSGYEPDDVRAAVVTAIQAYINSLTIGEDLVLAAMGQKIMEVDGVYDVIIETPVENVILLDDQLARTTGANIFVT